MSDELLSAEDYLCLECDYISDSPGLCPKHGKALLPYFDWLRAQKELDANTPLARGFNFIMKNFIYFLIIAGLAYLIYRFAGK